MTDELPMRLNDVSDSARNLRGCELMRDGKCVYKKRCIRDINPGIDKRDCSMYKDAMALIRAGKVIIERYIANLPTGIQ